ncbi:MAG: hypothetical protein WKG06_13045 [Segetibacter sp.]
MKPLDNLNNVERAKLLHELFPDEIPAILKFVKSLNITIEEEKEMLNSKWDNQLFSFAFWLSLAKDAEKKINQYGDKLHKSSRLFAGQLFDGYAALYLSHCLVQLTHQQKHQNIKFAKTVEVLFT